MRRWFGVRHDDYTTDRDMAAYAVVLGADFLSFVAALTPRQHWLDAGAGEGRAMRTLLAERGSDCTRLTAIGLVAPAEPPPAGMRYISGSPIDELGAEAVEPADLITDVYGPLQYTLRPDRVVERYAEWLAPGGRLWLASPSTTYVETGAGEVELADWLCGLDAFDVLRGPRPLSPARDVVLARNAAPAEVPPLELVLNVDGPPPLRRFREAR